MRDDRSGIGHLDHPGKRDRADLIEDRSEDRHGTVGPVLPHPGHELPVATAHIRDRAAHTGQFVHDDAREIVARTLPPAEELTGGQVPACAVCLGGGKAAVGDQAFVRGPGGHRGSARLPVRVGRPAAS
ncbi:hypothetical protein GCM10010327_56220 [Streptomyces nitrosporeus]|nr:hypothetical protein GCM10010327_56220 [Streptomyces nitrosporeus]